MAKYHIKKDGTPGVCRAQNGNCPFGGESEHFQLGKKLKIMLTKDMKQ